MKALVIRREESPDVHHDIPAKLPPGFVDLFPEVLYLTFYLTGKLLVVEPFKGFTLNPKLALKLQELFYLTFLLSAELNDLSEQRGNIRDVDYRTYLSIGYAILLT